jgi:hypothetical protein
VGLDTSVSRLLVEFKVVVTGGLSEENNYIDFELKLPCN